MSKEDFSKEYWHKGYVPLAKELLDLDTLNKNYVYFLKVYTNSSGMIATSDYITIVSMDCNKIIFTEAFYDL